MITTWNQYYAIKNGKKGVKGAAYNTKLMKGMMVPSEMLKKACKNQEVVLVLPDHLDEFEKMEERVKMSAKGYKIKASIVDSVAAELFHSTQNVKQKNTTYSRIIDIGETGTNITLVKCTPVSISAEYTVRVETGGGHLTDQLTDAIREKMGRRLSLKEKTELREKMEASKIRMSMNRQGCDKIYFVDNEIEKEYCVKLMREEFEKHCIKWMQPILKKLDEFDQTCRKRGVFKIHKTILCGGGSGSNYVNTILEKKYPNTIMSSYRGKDAALLGAAVYAKQIM